MNSLNSILIEGNLKEDPETTVSKKGTAICEFVISSERFCNGASRHEVSFFSIITWDKLAQHCSEHLKKGRGVRVVGRLKQNRWTDFAGYERSEIKIIAEHVEIKPDFKGGC